MKKILIPALVLSFAAGMSGCMTQSRVIAQGERAEVVAGFSQDDIDSVVITVIEKVNQASMRYAKPGKRRVVNVKDITIDTTARGRDASSLAMEIGQGIREGLTGGEGKGDFIVYNELFAAKAEAAGIRPEFVMFGTLKQRNMRKDNGDVYQEFSLNIQLVDNATGLEFWQKRIPLRKEVDKANAMN